MEYPSITAPMQGLWGRKLVKQRTVMMNTEKYCVLHMFKKELTGMFRNATLRQDSCALFQFHKYFTSQARGHRALLSGFFVFVR